MTQLRDKDSYWQSVNDNWERFEDLIFGMVGAIPTYTCAFYVIAEQKVKKREGSIHKAFADDYLNMPIRDALVMMRDKKDKRFWYFIQSVWEDVPDQPYIHDWPMWGLFCDWCSEGMWILFDKEEQV